MLSDRSHISEMPSGRPMYGILLFNIGSRQGAAQAGNDGLFGEQVPERRLDILRVQEAHDIFQRRILQQ